MQQRAADGNKKILGIENAPLLVHELELYHDRIWVLNELINTNRLAEAQAMQSEMAIILDLPFEKELYFLYIIAEVWLLISEFNFPAAEEKLVAIEALLDNVSNKALNLYHHKKGYLYATSGDYHNCLKHSLRALDYIGENESDVNSLWNICMSYNTLGKPYNAIIYLERAKNAYKGGLVNTGAARIKSLLAVCYILVHEYDKAKEMFDASMAQAKSLNDDWTVMVISGNLADLNRKIGNYNECIQLCEQALRLDKTKESSANILVIKALCLLEMKEFDRCQEALDHAKDIMQNEEKNNPIRPAADTSNLTHMFDSIGHLMTLDNNESATYIENVAIPHLRVGGLAKFDALYLCEKLEAHYKKKKSRMKALTMAAIARDIYKEIFLSALIEN